MAQLWIGDLGKDFTRYVHSSGEAVSDAARFCVRAYSILDPKTPESLVLNEMKKLIIEIRKYRQEEKPENSE